jgi:hypothetical protein
MEAALDARTLPINGKQWLILITGGIARLFLFTLSGSSGATVTDAQGQGTIVSDEVAPPPALPTIAIGETPKTVSVNGDTTKPSWWLSAAL